MSNHADNATHVYLAVSSTGIVKVGASSCYERRLKQIAAANKHFGAFRLVRAWRVDDARTVENTVRFLICRQERCGHWTGTRWTR
jgi:hypothetical protein